MKPIIIIAGTRDARRIIEELGLLKHLMIHATVATALGREFLKSYQNIQVHSGRLDKQGMTELIRMVKAVAVIDASHPFAVETSRNAINACLDTNTAYLRYEREETPITSENMIIVNDFNEAAERAVAIKGNILLTVGSNHLGVFIGKIPDYRERLFARVLPESRVIAKCEELGLTARQILALKGPFTAALNREIYQYCQAAVIVTKDSGETGGNPEKIAAAAQLNLPVIMVARPRLDYGRKALTIAEIIAFGKELA